MPELADLDQLMRRLADGDRSAFTPVFELLWPPTLRLCTRLAGSEADGADAAQTALLRILERANEYDRAKPALPWALGIASWEWRTLSKKKQRLRESNEVAPSSDAGAQAEEAEQRLLVEAAMNAMGTLSQADQETLVSTYWETAAAVGGATFRKRRERAVVRLRNAFKRLYGLD